ncbi:glycosyltransferase family 9 protein [Enterobacter hormaechei]|uniref:glycosyltransferase family 9 protein n=1 Tax=Enterobacter hormaechei TaxID=158836 RepID=UPI000F89338F|nr:glycosyltransferase family 9 protein [Enterobacter hormaechei]RTO96181.1 lipopolysaccharide heptosyltransferase family protein [Enterobacter hormaechei]
MTNLITEFKHLNRRRNIKTKAFKLRLRIIANDTFFKHRTSLPLNPHTVLIMMIGKGIGDAIVMTGLIKALTDNGLQVSVLTEPRLNAIFSHHPLIQNHYLIKRDDSDFLTFSKIKHSHYDILIDIDDIDIHSPLRVKTIKRCKPAHTIGVNQFARVYDTSINNIDKTKHITERHMAVARMLGCSTDKLKYTVKLTQADEIAAIQFIDVIRPSRLIILNPYGTEESRNMSIKQIEQLCSLLNHKLDVVTVIIGAPDKILSIPDSQYCIKFLSQNFSHAVALVRRADLVISTDTSIVHLCNALNKKLVSLYNNKISPRGEENNILWGPNYTKAVQLFSVGNRIDEILPFDIVSAVEDLLCINQEC